MAKTIQKESKIVYLQIGQNYEHLAETKQFDVSEWVSEFPDATIYMLFKRPGEEAVAPVQTTLEDGILTWTISNWETGVLGVGFAEIRAIDSSTGMVKKSHVIPCSIEASVTDEDVAPDYPSWVDRMLRYGENVESIYEGLTDAITEGKADIEQVASDTLSETTDALDDKAAEVLAEIPPTYTEVLEGIAKQYDSTKYYQKYEFVWHDGKIYLRLNNSSSPVGAWNPDDWSSPTDFATSMFELRYDMDWEKKLWDAMKAALYKDYVGYYDSQSSYNAGDVVWKDNANTAPIGFYRAKVDITPSSTYFVPANWDRLLGFDEQITGLKSALPNLDAKFDYQPELFTPVTGINKLSSYTADKLNSDGSVSPDASFYTSGLIDVSSFSGTLTAYACTNTTGVPHYGWYYKAFYDYFGEYIQGTYSQTANQAVLANATINIPEGAKYVRVCFTKYSAHNSLMLVDGTTIVNYEPYTSQEPSNISQHVAAIDSRTKTHNIKSINHLQESTIKDGYYNTSGVFSSTAAFVTFDDLIEIPSGATVVNGYSCNALGSPYNAFYTLVFYDANKEYKSGTRSSSQSNLDNSTYTIPDGACYVRPSFVVTSQATSYMVTFEDRLYGHDDFNAVDAPYNENLLSLRAEKFNGKRVLVIGDSISTPNYRGISQSGALLPLWPKWPQVLQKRLGFNLVSDAISASGFLVQPSTTTPGEQSICYRVDNYGETDNYDYIIIFAGINDWIQGRTIGEVDQTDRTANLSSAVYYTVKTLTDKYPSARILGITPLPTAYYSDPARNSIDALTEMLISQYEAFGIPFLDMRKMSGFKPGVSSFKEKFTLYANSGGTITHDGLHPNQAWDNDYLAPVIESFVDRFI